MTSNHKTNEIKHMCLFCAKEEIHLSWHKRQHKCSCGVTYYYQPRVDTPSRKYQQVEDQQPA